MKVIIVLLSIFVILGCTAENSAQIANPSAVYCEEQGYTYEVITNPDGSQSGFCVFSENDRCDGWAYYEGECGPESSNPVLNETINTLDVLSDINSALDEINDINVNDTGDVITPLTEEDLSD